MIEAMAFGTPVIALNCGSVDSTPFFVFLAGAYCKRTGDSETIKKIWLCLNWMDNYRDADRDEFLGYIKKGESGLVNQG